MKILFLITPIFLVFATAGNCAAKEPITEEDAIILALVLKKSYTDEGYTLVSPETTLSDVIDVKDPKEVAEGKRYLNEEFHKKGFNVNELVNRFFDRNKISARLTMKSSPRDGYIIDYEKEKSDDGQINWNTKNQPIHGSTKVSLPVYDSKTGCLLVYKGTQSEVLQGSGWVILAKFKNGNYKELVRVMAWIS
jgi:hypothetical protein